jgi:hypothetical protein
VTSVEIEEAVDVEEEGVVSAMVGASVEVDVDEEEEDEAKGLDDEDDDEEEEEEEEEGFPSGPAFSSS